MTSSFSYYSNEPRRPHTPLLSDFAITLRSGRHFLVTQTPWKMTPFMNNPPKTQFAPMLNANEHVHYHLEITCIDWNMQLAGISGAIVDIRLTQTA